MDDTFLFIFRCAFCLFISKKIYIKKIKNFFAVFIFLFILSPATYLYISLSEDNKRTDYPGKEIAYLVQNKWNNNFRNDIKIVIGDEWLAGNLSYHLKTRPVWMQSLKNKTSLIQPNTGVVYVGNSKILKEVCPGIFGAIKRVGYCMIGQK